MNIAIFSPSQNPYSETFIQAHKNYLKGQVFYYYGQGAMITLEGGFSLPTSRIKRLFLKLTRPFFRKTQAQTWKQTLLNSLKDNKIDVVLAQYGTHAHHILPLIKEAKLPMVVHFHGYDASIYNVVEKSNNYKEVFTYAKRIIAVSKKMEEMLLELGCPRDKLVYNVYGPQPEFAAIVPEFSKKQFIAIGRFTDKKAPYYTILAFREVLEKHPDAQLLFAGNGILLNACENVVKHLQLENNVRFLGVITSEEFRNYLSESLAFVQHSIRASNGDMEGTPLSVLEASSAGLPVISTYHAGIPDVILHKETGLLCDEHDVSVMAEHMEHLLNDIEYAKRLGQSGKIYIKEKCSMKRHIEMLDEILYKSSKSIID